MNNRAFVIKLKTAVNKEKLWSVMTKEKFFEARSTSCSMLPFITQSSLGSVTKKESSPEPSMIRNNKYGEFDIGSLKSRIKLEIEEREEIQIKRVK